MNAASGVLALVLAETAAGGAAFLFLTPLWGEVRRGFFYLTGGLIVVFAGLAALATVPGFDPGFEGAAANAFAALSYSIAFSVGTVLWLALLLIRLPRIARVVGFLTLPVAGGMLAFFAGAVGGSYGVALTQLVAGAIFTGAVLDGLLLGHWYLTDRKLTRGPINRMAWLLIGAVGVEAVAVLVGAIGAGPEAGTSASISPLLTVAGNATWIAFGMVACTGLIAAFIKATLRGTRPQAVQSATGFFYLAVITAFTAELAAKVRFLR
ncbi:MAG TPA: hypothetical protein VKA30_00930 [Actinomycetota bacterium]|nr:hypothetical protein [Actinomycetota bacterium]